MMISLISILCVSQLFHALAVRRLRRRLLAHEEYGATVFRVHTDNRTGPLVIDLTIEDLMHMGKYHREPLEVLMCGDGRARCIWPGYLGDNDANQE
jgi:hypothetical protein